ncbi:GNAT family N-acetyltransferase [Microvirga aerophila]|uniref:N-acetyltransferase GCN5 n=1 Tax=Microvirga aerophila TaxID=670291 RepID=A0A512BMZ3_9HYPH|nr:GNAT family N-acetyltransferase [Microvirga aerophila]GEO13328.1 N-acetyltransferase GCN5 [Microvirga aerophila]
MEHAQRARLTRSVEEACLNGWPALREAVFDGWLLRFADGYTRRANSVHLLSSGTCDPHEKIRSCETAYSAQGLPTIFCVSSMMQSTIGPALDGRGYGPPEDETRVLYRSFADGLPSIGEVELTERLPGAEWLRTIARLQGQRADAQEIHRRILESLAVPAVFAAIPVAPGRLGAVAFGAVHDRIVCVNSVATDPDFRRQGHAQRVISAILAWAQDRCGAKGACVPVVAGNAPAVALYEGLGFGTEAYRYHYRRHAL